jgi:5-methylcytosine-specific restriction enzyme subunit McrC
MTTLHLREWDETTAALTPRQAELLRTKFGCGVHLTGTGDNLYEIKPRMKIGAFADGDLTVTIAPKMPVKRVLFLLAYTADPTAWQDGDASLAEADTVTEGMAALYVAMCRRAVARGVLRGYRDVHKSLHTVRGRINLAEQIRTRPGQALPLAVSYQDHDEDIAENRLILAGLDVVGRLPVHSARVRGDLFRLKQALVDVTAAPDPKAIPEMTWTRLNEHYRPAAALARLLIADTEVDLAGGQVRTTSLVLNMAKVFEDFVRTAIRHALGVDERAFPSDTAAPRLTLDQAGVVRVKPDLGLWSGRSCRFVGEIKYRRDSGQGQADNLYQLLAYAIAARVPDATLIYANGPSHQTAHYLPHPGIHIHLRHLDLDVAPHVLLQQIGKLATHIKGLAY